MFTFSLFLSLKVPPKMSNKIDKPVYIGKFKILADGQKLHDDRIITVRCYGAEITTCARSGDESVILYGYREVRFTVGIASLAFRLGFGE